jgi:hypothetical protein
MNVRYTKKKIVEVCGVYLMREVTATVNRS